MRDRIKIYLLNRRLLRERGIKGTYWCTPCADQDVWTQISTLRFLLRGCECKMHRFLRRWGGLES